MRVRRAWLVLVATLLLGGCVSTTPGPAGPTPTGPSAPSSSDPQLIADQSYELVSTWSPCTDRTDPRLPTHCRHFSPRAGTGVGNGTTALHVSGSFSGTTAGGRTRLLFSAWTGGSAVVEYEPLPAAGNLTIGVEPGQWDVERSASRWLFRLDYEGWGRVDARVQVHAVRCGEAGTTR